jgi:hypothetical protein
MASPIYCLLLFLLGLTAGASAATFTITNNFSFTMWPAATPVGGGVQLNPGQTWTLDVPVGTSGRIWGRTGCSINNVVNGSSSSGHCATGDCSGELSCRGPGNPPTTEAEFTITNAAQDYYDISIIDGYNLAMDFSCSTGKALQCSCAGTLGAPTPSSLPTTAGRSVRATATATTR